jgi:hypothetical protein
MILRALAVWCLLVVLAVLNGGVRDIWLSPRLGDPIGRGISTLALCALILLASWATIEWIGPATRRDTIVVGAMWLALTLVFEFGVGHYGLGKPWRELLADYDLSRGRIWIAVLVVTLFAPSWAARLRGIVGPT